MSFMSTWVIITFHFVLTRYEASLMIESVRRQHQEITGSIMLEMTTINNEYYQQFCEDGYVIVEDLIGRNEVEIWKNTFHQLIQKIEPIHRPAQYGLGRQIVLDNLVEHAPEVMLPAVTNASILSLLEILMGPFIQLESLRINLTEPAEKKQVKVETRNWHRDMWALSVGQTKSYQPPHACNVLTYFQNVDQDVGPLRVLPNSHRNFDLVQKQFHAQIKEQLIYPKIGDVVIIHSALIHAASPNFSTDPRYFLSRFYNKSYLPHRDHHSGTNTQKILRMAQINNDRRLMRLFGIDDLIFSRQVDATIPESELWQRWIEEDRQALKKID